MRRIGLLTKGGDAPSLETSRSPEFYQPDLV